MENNSFATSFSAKFVKRKEELKSSSGIFYHVLLRSALWRTVTLHQARYFTVIMIIKFN